MGLTERVHTVFVFTAVFLLSIYSLIKRLASPDYVVNASDKIAMGYAATQECTLNFSSTWTPLVSCLNVFLGWVFEIPIIYLLVTVCLKFLIFWILFHIYKTLSQEDSNSISPAIVALFCLIFITIAGGGRYFIGGTELILMSSIYTGVWALLLTLASIYFFLQQRYLVAGLIISASVFIHPANTVHVFLILCLAYVITDKPKAHSTSFLSFSVPVIVALSVQYVAAFGWPDALLVFINAGSEPSVTIDNMASPALETTYSVDDWYNYIMSQDPDDLSAIWLLSSKYGFVYILFLLFGGYIATSLSPARSFSTLISTPSFSIFIAALFYLAICIMIEYFRYPVFLFEKLIITQPRRAFYVPPLFVAFFVIQYTLNFFWGSEKHRRNFITLILFYSFFFGSLLLTKNTTNISHEIIVLAYIVVIGTLVTTFVNKQSKFAETIARPMNSPRWYGVLGLVLVLLKTAPFISTQVSANATTLFFTPTTSRNYYDYLAIEAKLTGDDSYQSHRNLIAWFRENTDPNDTAISAGFAEQYIMDFRRLSGREVISLNVYRYRDSTENARYAISKC